MPFMQFLFSPQAHKLRDGYYINHDTLMPLSQENRHKLIFYFIAENVPMKLSKQDQQEYATEKTNKIGLPRSLWMMGAFLAPISYALYKTRGKFKKPVLDIGVNLIGGALLMTFTSSVFTRAYEGRFVDSSEIIDRLSKKYKFTVYDFSVAKKESHILKLMETMDHPYSTLHS